MSDLMLDHVRNLVSKVSSDLQTLSVSNSENFESLLGAVNDIAGNILAMEAVIAAVVKKYPVDAADAKGILKARLGAEPSEQVSGLVDYLVTGK